MGKEPRPKSAPRLGWTRIVPSGVALTTAALLAATVWHVGDAAIDKVYPLWLDIGIAAALAGAGMAARRSGKRFSMWGALVLAGWGWLPQVLAPSASSWIFTLSLAGSALWVGPLVQAVVGYPDGDLRGLTARAAVVLAWFHGTVLWMLQAMFVLRRDAIDVPENRLKVAGSHPTFDWVEPLAQAMPPVIGVLACAALAIHWWRWSPAQRVRFAPVVALSVLLLCVDVAIQLAGSRGAIANLYAAEQILVALLAIAFLAGFVGDLADRLLAGRLVVEAGASSADLRAALASALRDPLVTVAVDAAREVPPGRRPVELVVAGDPVGVLFVDAKVDHDPGLLATAAHLAALVLERERLAAEAEAHLLAVQASRARIVQAVDDERRRIERNLHDGAQQLLLGIALRMGQVRDDIEDPEMRTRMQESIDLTRTALEEIRALGRGLHPTLLADAGLRAAVRSLVLSAAVPTTVSPDGPDEAKIAASVQTAAYYVVSEALANVAKHAVASAAAVRLEIDGGELVVGVSDDGKGGAALDAGSGLVGLGDRVAAVGGTLSIDSPSGRGTTVTARLPLVPSHV